MLQIGRIIKLFLPCFLAFSALGATITVQIDMQIAVDGGGPQSYCFYHGAGPVALCEVSGRGNGQAQAVINQEGNLSIGAGGSGSVGKINVTATLTERYSTEFVGKLIALLNFDCTTGGAYLSGYASFAGIACGNSGGFRSINSGTVLLPVQAANGWVGFDATWMAQVSTLGDSEYSSSNLRFMGFQDTDGNPVAASAASDLPEPTTTRLLSMGSVWMIHLARRQHLYS